ncbi:VirB4 family type IV secretion system protein [Bacillus pseudomycoides]|uniref:VirB4 family type IV secretion system protein n=1 Tax=Bacillus pseudomycoides TaxID=64104 RepID=UPI000BEC2142|nr:type IV secretion system protein VirB4 [Bacillus pseudomycoides]PDX97359.1 type IV secretion system protein VirB4 [Bacillus pseudomycoides]PEK74285.1 type IV secretion system protein VirB4 [Bacillus pseudomycoides]PEN00849.1 type IV secretion system protein VirB4 [Bacillus pseudomycoides]
MNVSVLNFLKRKQKKEEKKEKKLINKEFVAQIQPQGGIQFKEVYVQGGDGLQTCIHVYGYQTTVNDFWQEPIMNMPNVITTMDIISDSRKVVIESINKSMAEQSVRHANAKDNIERIEAEQQFSELETLYQQVSKGEVLKRVHLRIYISARTMTELEKQAKEVMETLESYNFRGAIFLNEQEYEWASLTSSFEMQKKYINKRNGKEIPALSLAGGFPFHFTFLNDPYGIYYGTTKTKGSVIFDLFHKDKQRKSYNGVVIGKMGAGKSTLLKKIMSDNAMKGYKIRGFDFTGEFEGIVQEYNGKQIALDGSQGQINPLQVYKTAETEESSFTQHLSKMSIFYRFIAPEAKDDEIKEYENLLRKLYVKKELWSDELGVQNNITSLSAKEYPIFSDYLHLVRLELYENLETGNHRSNVSSTRKKRLELIELNLANLVDNFGHLFNGVSTIDDFSKEQIVFFSLRHLMSLKPEIYQAQIFNVMNLMWDEMLENGKPQWKAFDRKEIQFDDVIRYLIIMDEAHHLINTSERSQHAVQFTTKFSREARKYFAGIVFASHSIRDFVPEDSNLTAVEEIKKLFELTQYKFIMQQDSNNLDMLRRVFAGQISTSELNEIPFLPTGDVLLCISAVKNILFKVDVTEEELALFGGGA